MNAKRILLALLVVILALGAVAYGPAYAKTQVYKITGSLTANKYIDVFLRKGGVYFAPSVYTGSVVLERLDPKYAKADDGLFFYGRWLDFTVYDFQNKEIKSPRGFISVYFNLNKTTRSYWDKGLLKIYYYDQNEGEWVACPYATRLIGKNYPHGRVACYTNTSGTYAMVYKK